MKKKLFLIPLLIIALILIGLQVLSTDSDTHEELLTASSEPNLILVDGGVGHPLNLTYHDLVAMQRSTVSAELVCPGFFTIKGNWTGPRLKLVLEKAGFDPDADTVKFFSQDGYEVSLSMRDAMREDVIVAYEKDGKSLPEMTRLVIPGTVGGQWISNVAKIALPSATGRFPIAFPIATVGVVVAATTTYVIQKRKHAHSLPQKGS